MIKIKKRKRRRFYLSRDQYKLTVEALKYYGNWLFHTNAEREVVENISLIINSLEGK